jgi:hypothetical protein
MGRNGTGLSFLEDHEYQGPASVIHRIGVPQGINIKRIF